MPAPLENGSDDGDELPARRDGCADLELESGEVVIYDTGNHSAWIQSDGAVELTTLA